MNSAGVRRIERAWAAIAAVTVLNLPLGSIYAFSVFLKPIEAELALTRSALSLVFGLATVAFTLGMLIAPYTYGLTSAAALIAICMASATIGIVIAASAEGLTQLLLGYSVLFGLGGGVVYIVAQQSVNMLVTTRKGLVNGYIVGLYPAGAMVAAPLFGWARSSSSSRWAWSTFCTPLIMAARCIQVSFRIVRPADRAWASTAPWSIPSAFASAITASVAGFTSCAGFPVPSCQRPATYDFRRTMGSLRGRLG